MLRATKIIATLGPASEKPEVLRDMIRAGVDVVRMNFSHGTVADHKARHDLVRSISAEAGKEVGIMADLQGPKIRVGKFAENKILLKEGDKFILDAALGKGPALAAAQMEEVKKLRAEGERLHKEAKHAESMAALQQAKRLLGI